MTGRPWWTPRRIAVGVGLVSIGLGLFMITDPIDRFAAEDAPVLIGAFFVGIGLLVLGASAWIARHRADDSPWDPLLEQDAFGGL